MLILELTQQMFPCFNKPFSLSTVMQDLQQELRERVPAAAAHDQPRRERVAPQVQVQRLRQSLQVQAPPQGAPPHPQRRETLRVRQLRQEILPLGLLFQSHDLEKVSSNEPQDGKN